MKRNTARSGAYSIVHKARHRLTMFDAGVLACDAAGLSDVCPPRCSSLPLKLNIVAHGTDASISLATHVSGTCAAPAPDLTTCRLPPAHSQLQGEPELCLMQTGVPAPDQQQPHQQQPQQPDQAWPASLLPFRVPPKRSPVTPCMPLGWHRKAPPVPQLGGTAEAPPHPGQHGAVQGSQDKPDHPIVHAGMLPAAASQGHACAADF